MYIRTIYSGKSLFQAEYDGSKNKKGFYPATDKIPFKKISLIFYKAASALS